MSLRLGHALRRRYALITPAVIAGYVDKTGACHAMATDGRPRNGKRMEKQKKNEENIYI